MCPLADPARTDCRGEGGSILELQHSRGLRCRLLRCGRRTGQFLRRIRMVAAAMNRASSAIPAAKSNPRAKPIARAWS
jgi:hypothetical protein